MLMKEEKMIELMKKSLIDIPSPLSISFLWNMGFLLGTILMMQIITGIFLSMNYIPNTTMSFNSIIHIMRDIDYGMIIRYLHMNGSSMFFLFMYMHIFRGIYFNSPKNLPMVWMSGMMILLLSMMTAFMGYVLPWGQMSLWGATVITSMISAFPYIGKTMMIWMWGNFSVSQPTLNRLFSLHFMFPMIILLMILSHLILLHEKGSSNPSGTNPNLDKMKFFPYFFIKDIISMLLILMPLTLIMSINPNIFNDEENFTEAMSMVTPIHIKPEWYFLFAYAILRSIPSKLGGIMAMIFSITILILPTMKKSKMNKKFSPMKKMLFWMMINTLMLLTWLGGKPIEEPFYFLSKLFSMMYFILMTLM